MHNASCFYSSIIPRFISLLSYFLLLRFSCVAFLALIGFLYNPLLLMSSKWCEKNDWNLSCSSCSFSSKFLWPRLCKIPSTSFFSTDDLIFQPVRLSMRGLELLAMLSKASFKELSSDEVCPNSSRFWRCNRSNCLPCLRNNKCLRRLMSVCCLTILLTFRAV